jgi:large subunit ribosomal protein L25
MTTEILIKPRENKKPKALRREGQIPATLYGPEIEAQSIQLNAKDFSKVPFEDYNRLITLKGDQEHEALIKTVQKDFITREVQNIEFYKIKRGHKVTMKVAIKFTGDSPAVKMGADFVPMHQEAHIKCFPRHIPYFIEVNISSLKASGDHITFADLNINREEIEILDPAQEIICKAESKKKDHTVEPVEAPAAEGEAKAEEAKA